MKIDFKNKVVLITGASRGIGFQLAKDYAALDAKLILTAASPANLGKMHKSFKKAQYCLVDFTDAISTQQFLKALDAYSRIDVCVNNAGINEIDFIENARPEAWERIIDVNLKAPFLLTRLLASKMKKNKYGRIVNISSILGVVTRPKRAIYAASKSGILGLTRTAAVELARYNILVNAVSPGFVLTDLTRRVLSKAEMKDLTGQIPSGRMADPSDITKTILFLTSALNTYIVGQNIIVDGGYVTV